MIPFYPMPYFEDKQEVIKLVRWQIVIQEDFKLLYPNIFFTNWYHPQRELNDGIIHDEELRRDV